jgi:hypothetical protein
VEYFNYLGSLTTNVARCKYEIKARISMAKVAFYKKENLSTSKLDLNIRNPLVNCKFCIQFLFVAFKCILYKKKKKKRSEYPKSFEMRCRRRMVKISWTNCVKNDKESLESRGKGTTYISYIQ